MGTAVYVAVHAAVLRDEPAPTQASDAPGIVLTAGLGALIGWAAGGKQERVLIYAAAVAPGGQK